MSRRLLWLPAVATFAYLFAPIFVMVAFGFNEPRGRFNVVWQRFSLDAWRHPLAAPGLADALRLSLSIAVVSTAIAVVLGTLLAVGLARRRSRSMRLLLVLPLTAPDVVLGASLLSLLLAAGLSTGSWTIVAAHVLIALAYVSLTVAARLRGLDPALEEAAMDLGAGEWRTLRTITLPLAAPAILAGALLAFALSIDDFTLTLFVSGSRVTFPLFVWGASRVAVPPQINVLGTLVLLAGLAALVAGSAITRRRRA